MKRRDLWVALLVITSLGAVASAGSGGLALTASAGNLGFGGELLLSLLPGIDGHFNAACLPLGLGGEVDDDAYDLDQSILRHHPLFMISLIYRF